MKLSDAPGAGLLAVHIASREIGASVDRVTVDLARHVTLQADLERVAQRAQDALVAVGPVQ